MTIMVRASQVALIMVAACVGLAPAHAAPPTQSGSYAVRGNVVGACSLGNSISLATNVGSAGTLDPTLHDRTWVIPGWFCSTASTIRLSSTSLRLSTPRASLRTSESQTVNFTARATGWSPVEARVVTGDTGTLGSLTSYSGPAQVQSAAQSGSITLKVDDFVIVGTTNRSTPRLVSGSYSARIVITLAPNL
jgi:hypothetical protein